VDEKTELNAAYCIGRLLPVLIADCKRLLPGGFIFQQGGAPQRTTGQVSRKAGCSKIAHGLSRRIGGLGTLMT
jgi:hypothetical protein